MRTKRTKIEQDKLDREIMRRLSEFHSVRDITQSLNTSWLTVTKRAIKAGYEKHLITREERDLIMRIRKHNEAATTTEPAPENVA